MAITAAMRTQVSQFYVAMFGRAPDSEGLGYWVGLLDGGATPASVANTMFAIAPAREYFPSWMTNSEIITSFYVNVLGREPDLEGLNYWTGKLNAVGATPGSVIVQMIDFVANYTGSNLAGQTSAALFNNKVAVAQYYGEHNGTIAGAAGALTGVTADVNTVNAAKAVIDSGVLHDGYFTLEASAPSVNEGQVVNFTLTAEAANIGKQYVYELTGVSASDVVGGQLAGVVTIGSDGKAVVSVRLSADRTTEGAETLTLNVVGHSQSVTVNDTSLSPTYTLTKSADAVNESGTAVFTLQTTNVDEGATFDYTITGVFAADVVGGALTGTAVIGADGKAEIRVQLAADGIAEGTESLTLNVAGRSQTVTVNDTSVDAVYNLTVGLDNFTGPNAGSFADNLYVGTVASSHLLTGQVSTYTGGDRIDGGAGSDTLQLFMERGAVADGVSVSNVENLDLRLEARGLYGDTSVVFMTDWDTSLEHISIRSNKSELALLEQQNIATIAISDQSTLQEGSSYDFNYAAGVLDGGNDKVSISLDNVNGSDGAYIGIEDGMEGVDFTIADRAGAQYASDVNLVAGGVQNITVAGGRTGQSFTLDANVASGADFDSRTFLGNMVLASADIKTAHLGAGSDEVEILGQANLSDSSYNLGEGHNTLTIGEVGGEDLDLAGDVTAGSGNDEITVTGNATSTASIDAGNGDNTVTVDGALAGSIAGGTGDDAVTAGSTADGGTIAVGEGDNEVTVTGVHAGSITAGDGNDTVSAGSTAVYSYIDVGNGNNTVTVTGAHAGNITAGTGNDTVTVGSTVGATLSTPASRIELGDGNNTATVMGVHAGVLTTGTGNDTIVIGAENIPDSPTPTVINGGTITTGDGTDTVSVWGNMNGGSIDVGAGNDNDVLVTGSVSDGDITVGDGNSNSVQINGNLSAVVPGTISFGNGNDNELSIGGSVYSDDIEFGTGSGNDIAIGGSLSNASITVEGTSTTVAVGGTVGNGSSITLGNGDNVVSAENGVTDGSTITTGNGDDTVTIGALSDEEISGDPVISGIDVATVINTGAGDDHVVLRAAGEDNGPYIYLPDSVIQSGGFVHGGEDDDKLTLRTEGSIDLISRTELQQATIDLSAVHFAIGDEITVTFTRGEETITVTILADEVIQGPENLAATVAQALADELDDLPAFNATASSGVITITSEDPQEDYGITWHVNDGEPVDARVDQISDARITSFETLELVALDAAGEDHTTISANFDLIDGTHTVELDSQVDLVKTTHEYYDSYAPGGVTTFELTNLKGGEAIHVSGNETSATGNQQVEKITVDNDNGDHEVGDKITVIIGSEVVEYIVTATDLAGANATTDANNIATSLAAAIRTAAEDAGYTLTRDGNELWLVGQPGEYTPFVVTHTRELDQTVYSYSDSGESGASYDLNPYVGSLRVGDVITVTVGAVDYTYTIQEKDLDPEACQRSFAEEISSEIAAIVPGATANWGRVNFDGAFSITVERTVDNLVDQTTIENIQSSSNVDDGYTDVVVDATLADGATDTNMDLTVHGAGAFDIALTANGDNPYTDLDLKLGDEFSHTIDTNGDAGAFADSITVSDLEGVDNAGEQIVLENVLAHTVTSTSAANLDIDQYGVRSFEILQDHSGAPGIQNAFIGEVITVTTGSGDDHLTTLAQSAINGESSIDLGEGSNTLSLGWGSDASPVEIGSSDLEAVGGIDYSGNLTSLEILNDVVLTSDATTTLAMPGGAEGVESVLFYGDVTTEDGSDANLTVEGAAADFVIGAYGDFDLGSNGVETAVGRLLVNGEVENLMVRAMGDLRVNIDNSELQSLSAEAVYGDATVDVAYNDGRTFDLGDVQIGSIFGSADFGVLGNTDTEVTTDTVTMMGEDYAEVVIGGNSDSTVTMGDISLAAGEDADVQIVNNALTDVTLGNIDITVHGYGYGDTAEVMVSGGYRLNVETQDITIQAEEGAMVEVTNTYESNVSLAADGAINLTSCDSDAVVLVAGNLNAYDPNENGPDEGDVMSRTFDITLGDVNLDAGEDASVVIAGNSDATYFGDLRVTVGDVTATAYNEAEVVIADNVSTTVELGDVDLLAQSTASLDLYGNHGLTYLAAGLPMYRREIDYAHIDIGAVNLESTNADTLLWVSDSTQTIVDISDVDMTAATDVDIYIGENAGEDYGSSLGLQDFQVHIASITTDSGEDTTLTISDNDAITYSGYLYFSDSASTVEITTGAVDITAGSDADVSISDNDAMSYGSDTESTVTIEMESVTVDAGGQADLAIQYNDAGAWGGAPYGGSSTVNVTLGPVVVDAGTNANLYIYENNAGAVSDGTANVNISILSSIGPVDAAPLAVDMSADNSAWVEIDYNGAQAGWISPFSDGSTATVTIKLGNVQVDSGEDTTFYIDNNSAQGSDGDAEVGITVGDVTIDAGTYVYFDVYSNNANTDEAFLSDSSTANVSVTLGAVDITADTYANVYVDGNDATTSDGGTADVSITIDTVDVVASDSVTMGIYGNTAYVGEDGLATVAIDVSDVTIDAGDDITFYISDNDAISTNGGQATLTVDVRSVDLTSGADVYFDITGNDASDAAGNDATVDITLGDVTIGASDDVSFHVQGNSDGIAGTVNVDLGDVTIDAGNDVVFVADGYGSTTTTLGDVTISAGLDAVGATVSDGAMWSDVYVVMNEIEGTESVTISADSNNGLVTTGDSDIFASFTEMADLRNVTVSGTNAELYFNLDMGASVSSDDFTLDLSGMTGSFGGDAEYYHPAGINADVSDADNLDNGTYVVNVDADFGNNAVIVKIGSGDLIYNAQHSSFGSDAAYSNWYYSSGDPDVDFAQDWNGQEGWYSLGGADLDVGNAVRTLTFGSIGSPVTYTGGEDSSATFTVDFGGNTYTIDLDISNDGDTWQIATGSVGAEDLVDALGNGASIGASFNAVTNVLTVTITGTNDGSAVAIGNVSDLNSVNASGNLVSDLVTTPGNTAADGVGNGAGEIFTFTGTDIGDVVIGGFQPNGFLFDISGEVDRIDLSAFSDIHDAGDLIITWDDSDGYFADIVIDFVNSDYGSIRLVGAGEFFNPTNVNGIANSIIFG